jgi:hypothetical protein
VVVVEGAVCFFLGLSMSVCPGVRDLDAVPPDASCNIERFFPFSSFTITFLFLRSGILCE